MKPLDGPAGPERDFTDLHAWAEVYLPGAGWIGLDPTSGLLAGEGHIPLACTADPGQRGAGDRLHRRVRGRVLVRDAVDARARGPARHQALHRRAVGGDSRISGGGSMPTSSRHDVRLTQGGEPTFVSVDDMEGPEWNHTALSPKKRELAETLLRRLAGRFADGGFLHFGQGKWYPGEPLPRWALGVWWRTDGRAALARRPPARRHARAGGADLAAAQRFTGEARAAARPCRVLRAHRVRGPAEAAAPRRPRFRPTPTRCTPISRSPTSARGSRALLLQGLERPAGFVLPLRAPGPGADAADAVADEPVAAEARAPLPAAGRFAARLALAAGVAAGDACRKTSSPSIRSIRSRRATRCPARPRSRSARPNAARSRGAVAPQGRDQDGAVRRGARRPRPRVHAAADARSRTTSTLLAAVEATRRETSGSRS